MTKVVQAQACRASYYQIIELAQIIDNARRETNYNVSSECRLSCIAIKRFKETYDGLNCY